ncbi:MAG TPA: helix-turn-helix domain-containing protein [Acidimicrobiales bacterium]|nr:helix-turn-helix domain-containing protein [Acidimicrobiales bacterium]
MSSRFWSDLTEDLKDPEFLGEFVRESIRISTIDRVVAQLDEAREAAGVSKAELARALGAHAAAVRRLFSAEHVNPTLGTVAEVAGALGLRVTLEPLGSEEGLVTSEPLLAGSSRDQRAVAKQGVAMRCGRRTKLVS